MKRNSTQDNLKLPELRKLKNLTQMSYGELFEELEQFKKETSLL